MDGQCFLRLDLRHMFQVSLLCKQEKKRIKQDAVRSVHTLNRLGYDSDICQCETDIPWSLKMQLWHILMT